MPDALGLTVFELEQECFFLREDIERMGKRSATNYRQRGNAVPWLTYKEWQHRCPNLPPIRPA